MTEIWKPVAGRENYEISNLGRVRNGCTGVVLRPALNRGYPAVALHGKTAKVHALVAEAFVGPRPEGQEVRHRDGDRLNARAENLHYGTRTQNMADMIVHGTRAHGSRFKSAKLTDAVVRALRRSRDGSSYQSLARRYGCSWQTIQKAVTGKTWRHV